MEDRCELTKRIGEVKGLVSYVQSYLLMGTYIGDKERKTLGDQLGDAMSKLNTIQTDVEYARRYGLMKDLLKSVE